jgi:nucleoprotein TPR
VSVQEDLRRQAQLAHVRFFLRSSPESTLFTKPQSSRQDAHEKYNRELVAHAEAVKQVSRLKEELREALAQARESQTAAETAIASAANSETTWNSQKEALSKEMEDISNRCKDLTAQNAALHQHLETISSQAARIRQAADSTADLSTVPSTAEGADPDDALAELRSVIAFVRREKEIAELQLDLNKQENIRLRSYSDHLAQTLEATRISLKEVRSYDLGCICSLLTFIT